MRAIRLATFAFLLLVLLASCSMTAGTPYESREACMKDYNCSRQFTRYLDCKQMYETGCENIR